MADDDLKRDTVYEVLAELTMRKSEDKQSVEVQKIPPKTFILLVEQGSKDQAIVRDLRGTQGWVTIADADEELLVRSLQSNMDTTALWKAATSEVQKAKESAPPPAASDDSASAAAAEAAAAAAKELKECKDTLKKCQDEVASLQKELKESESQTSKEAAAAKAAAEEARKSADEAKTAADQLRKCEEALKASEAKATARAKADDEELDRQRSQLEAELNQAASYRREASSAVDAALAARERFDREESEAQAAYRRAKLIASAESTSAASAPPKPVEESGAHLTKERLRSEEQDLAHDKEDLKLQRESFELEKHALASELRAASDEQQALEKERQDVKVEQQSCAKQASEARVAAEEALAACVATAEERNELEETVQRVAEELERGEERAAKGSVTWQLIKALESDVADAARTAIQEMEASRRYQGIAEEASRERLELKSERDQLRKELRDLSRLSRFAPVLRPTR